MKMEERDRMIEERGKQLGAQAKLTSQVQKKLSLGQSAAQIAEDLVEEPAVIQSIIALLSQWNGSDPSL